MNCPTHPNSERSRCQRPCPRRRDLLRRASPRAILRAPKRRTMRMEKSKLSLELIRKQIDEVDTKLLELLNQRADLVHEVGVVKKEAGLAIYAQEPEEHRFTSIRE